MLSKHNKSSRIYIPLILVLVAAVSLPTAVSASIPISAHSLAPWPPGTLHFAVIGDYGSAGQPELDVANLVRSWNPDFVITTGDNNYSIGAATTIDANIGQYYHEFIYPYTGAYGAGAAFNRFFPTLGNHDWGTTNAQPYIDYFSLPGNERYYEFVWGAVHFFVIDSDPQEPDGILSSSIQGQWLQARLAASTAPWKLVYLHHPPYSSGADHGSTPELQWPYQAWGANAVLAGHDHTYERIRRDGIPYFVNGLGGQSIGSFRSPISGSQIRYRGDYGAMLVYASEADISFQFIARTGAVIDTYTLSKYLPPVTLAGNAGVGDATMSYMEAGAPKSVLSDGNGNYAISVTTGWTGTVTPRKIGYQFTPASKSYSDVQSDLTVQDYTAQVCPTCADKDTIGVFRPGNGALYLRNLNVTGFADVAINYGLGKDYPVVGDWDGDGIDTIGVYRNGIFYLRNSNTLGFADLTIAFGSPGDQPIAGDWDGDGIDTIGVYHSATGQFLLRNGNTSGDPEMSFYLGNAGDVGIAGDWDGDGTDTTGVFRPSNGVIFLKNTNVSGFADVALNYGLPGDQPVVGDWDNNGTTTIGIFRNARFYLRNSNTNGFADILLDLGNVGDMPIAGNWDNLP